MSDPKLLRNAWLCLTCEDVVESKSLHDFRTCSCGAMSVDGGTHYSKVCAKDMTLVEWVGLYEGDSI